MESSAHDVLTEESLTAAVRELASRDADVAAIVERYGHPPMWRRPPGFATILRLILEQQVSLASAKAAYDRLCARVGSPTPAAFLSLDDRALLDVGFSRQKATYVRGLARSLEDGELNLERLSDLADDEAYRRLVALKGIGPWTASIYLLMALLRPDIWPASDIALATAVADARGLSGRPRPDEMESLGRAWMPWRSVAARIFWLDYLRRRDRTVRD